MCCVAAEFTAAYETLLVAGVTAGDGLIYSGTKYLACLQGHFPWPQILVIWTTGQTSFRDSFQDTHSRQIVYITRKGIVLMSVLLSSYTKS